MLKRNQRKSSYRVPMTHIPLLQWTIRIKLSTIISVLFTVYPVLHFLQFLSLSLSHFSLFFLLSFNIFLKGHCVYSYLFFFYQSLITNLVHEAKVSWPHTHTTGYCTTLNLLQSLVCWIPGQGMIGHNLK